MKPRRRRIAALFALLAFGGCLWRPPIIPPLGTPDSSVMPSRDAGAFSDSSAPAPDSDVTLSDQEACARAAAANDGSVPEVVSNNGRDVSCAAFYSDASAGDATASDATASDATASDARDDRGASADGGERDAASADDAGGADASSDGSSDGSSG